MFSSYMLTGGYDFKGNVLNLSFKSVKLCHRTYEHLIDVKSGISLFSSGHKEFQSGHCATQYGFTTCIPLQF